MYERSYGYLYETLGKGYVDTADIAKAIRADIKVAKAEGLLPKGWKYSVRIERFSGGSSINVSVRGASDAWMECDGSDGEGRGCPNVWCAGRNDPARAAHAERHARLTPEGAAAKMTLERIHGAYNHDGSEVMTDYFDVRYYGSVTFDWEDRPVYEGVARV